MKVALKEYLPGSAKLQFDDVDPVNCRNIRIEETPENIRRNDSSGGRRRA